jgi:hypothetical protein
MKFVPAVFLLAAALFFADAATGADNRLDKMSVADRRALNVFFSNFCESSLGDFDADDYNDGALIAFAMSHNVINNRELFKDDDAEGMSYIGRDRVDATIEKYFGIKGVKPRSVEDGAVIYKHDRYYWDDVFEGSPWFAGGQAVELYDEKDGTLSAVVELYQDNEAFQNDVMKIDTGDFYAPKKSWKGNTAKYYEIRGYYAAKIAPYSYNGKKTYRLLEWREAETLNEARKLIGK